MHPNSNLRAIRHKDSRVTLDELCAIASNVDDNQFEYFQSMMDKLDDDNTIDSFYVDSEILSKVRTPGYWASSSEFLNTISIYPTLNQEYIIVNDLVIFKSFAHYN